MPSRITKEAKKPRSYAETLGSPKPPFTTGRNAIRAWMANNSGDLKSWKRRTESSKACTPTWPWTTKCSRMCFQKSGKAW